MTNPDDPKEIISSGYNALSYLYRKDEDATGHYKQWIDLLRSLLEPPAKILDLGCGCGVPVARDLAETGFSVTGVDISEVQVARAKQLVTNARFVHGDFTSSKVADELEAFAPPGAKATFAAVVCLYAIIHVPVDEQRGVLHQISTWLEDGGYALVLTGISPLEEEQRGWLGSDHSVRMQWSHAGVEEFRVWIRETGFEVLRDEHQPDPLGEGESEGHQFFLLQKRRALP
ncbi:hypothetical protein HGRIS_005398 [Hohenbuehelia grisea]|uniref:Methyltransferase domain-containing protein n=1 Tax=Hohenbuehelia grisea TaxID=104357 RepID=A0ABR3JFM6_9AGAR